MFNKPAEPVPRSLWDPLDVASKRLHTEVNLTGFTTFREVQARHPDRMAEIRVTEGNNRQVRRITAAVGTRACG
jgi:16S rRNA U516 pseudouridylate synthase RsuA-like enzyme